MAFSDAYKAVKGQVIDPIIDAINGAADNVSGIAPAKPTVTPVQEPISLSKEGIASAAQINAEKLRQEKIAYETGIQKESVPPALMGTAPTQTGPASVTTSTKTTDLVQTGTGSTNDVTPPLAPPTEIVSPTVKKPDVSVTVPFEMKTSGVVTQEQMTAAMASPEAAKSFFSANYATLTQSERDALSTRMSQPTNIADLQSARTQEGWDQAKSTLMDVNRRVQEFNAKVDNIENEVRRDLSGASESRVQAEINARMGYMRDEANRLGREQAGAQANYGIVSDAVTQHFNAVRADAKEKVDTAMQRVDFNKDNINTSYSLMTGMKQYEITTDAQVSAKRDAARSEAAIAIAAKNGLSRYTPEQLANLSQAADFSPGLLAGIRDVQASGDMVYQSVDDSGAYVYAVNVPGKGLNTGRFNNFATVYQKVSAETIANAKLFSNATPKFRSELAQQEYDLLAVFGNNPKTPGKPFTVEQKTQQFGSAAAALGKVAAETGNDADWAAYQTFLGAFKTPGQLTSDEYFSILNGLGMNQGN